MEKSFEQLWKHHESKEPVRVDIVLDNAGFELFGDLCLAELLLEAKLASKIYFHVKAMPWFVSDTTLRDFTWTLEMLRGSDKKALNELGITVIQKLNNSTLCS